MKNLKDTILEKLKIKATADSNFHIEKMTSNDNNVLNFMMRDIPFYEFEYDEYIKDILNSDIDTCEKIKGALNSNFSNLKELLPVFLNIILTIMNKSKSDHIRYNISQFVKKINKFYKDKELFVTINYSYLGLDSERYVLVFGAKGDDFTTDDILKLFIEKY